MKKSKALDILGLSSDASDEDIKAAHRKKVIEHHPDRFALNSEQAAQAEEKTKLINEARDVLLSGKWEPEYAYRAPYANPYGSSSVPRPGGQGSSPYDDWPFGQGQQGWVWTSWDVASDQDGTPFDPFPGARQARQTPKEAHEAAKKDLSSEIVVVIGKMAILALLALLGSLPTGLFLYVIVSVVYGIWKKLGGCLIVFFVPIAFMLVPFMMIFAPQAGNATIGLLIACVACLVFDARNVYRAIQAYRKTKLS